MNPSDISTDQAFAALVNEPWLWHETGLPMTQRRQLAHRLQQGVPISLEKKIELLRKAGFVVQQEMSWKMPQ